MKKSLSYILLLSFLIIFVSACSPDTQKSNKSVYESENLTNELNADAGNGEVTLNWQYIPAADSYNIYWIADTEGKYSTSSKPSNLTMLAGTKVEGILTAPYTVTGLTNGTKYWFALSGSSENPDSYLTVATYSTPIDPAPLPAPQNFRANVISATSVKVFWDDVPTASGYIAYCYTIDDDLQVYSKNSGKLPEGQNYFTFTNLEENYYYLFFVQAVDNDDSTSSGDSSASFSYYVETSAIPPPNAPTNPAVTNEGNGDIIVSWDTMTGATSYNIYIAHVKGVSKSTGIVTAYNTPDDTARQAATAKSLANGTYYIVVTAVNDNGTPSDTSDDLESAESREVSIEITDNP